MYRITFVIDPLRTGNRVLGTRATQTMLAALMLMDVDFLHAHPEVPSCEDAVRSGRIKMIDLPAGQEDWRDIPTMLSTGVAEMRDIAAWKAAEERVRRGSKRAYPKIVRYPTSHRIRYHVDLFKGEHERDLSHKALQTLLTALTAIDEDYLRAHPETPDIYSGVVRYEEEPIGQEDWQDIPTSIRMGIVDCEDNACWRAAQLRVQYGVDAWPTFTYKLRSNGSYLYHITVRHPTGEIEDPSRRLGMR